jgi:hypothetical protein
MQLTVDKLMDRARADTGLDDFGEPSFLVGLQRLVDSIERHSELTDIGLAATEAHFVSLLASRLQIEDWYRRHPEIDDEIIRSPVFIVGLPRTGTTVLGNMLGLDVGTRSLRGWEALAPCPPPDIRMSDDPRIHAYTRYIAFVRAQAPSIADAIPLNADAPEEDYTVLDLTFACFGMNGRYHVPDYEDWALAEDNPEVDAAYRYHRRVLKLLQWKTPAARWSLRTPVHSACMRPLLKAYPDARFIWTHREPAKVIPSICSLINLTRKIYMVDSYPAVLGERQLEQWAVSMERLLRDRSAIGDDRFFDIYHRDLIEDPQHCLRRLYAWLGWEFSADFSARLAAWQRAYPKGDHRPDAALFGLDAAKIERRFAKYSRQFFGAAQGGIR